MLRANAAFSSFRSVERRIGLKLNKVKSSTDVILELKKEMTEQYFIKSIRRKVAVCYQTRSNHNTIKASIQKDSTLSIPSLYTHMHLVFSIALKPKPAQLVSIAIMPNKPTPAIKAADTGGVLKSAAREDFVSPSAPFFSTRTFHTYSAPVVFYVTFSCK